MAIKLKKVLIEGRITPEQKATFLEAMQSFNSYGEQIYREHDLKGLAETMTSLSNGAGNFMLGETEDWFDAVTVKRDVKEINAASQLFEKTANEVAQLQNRLESLYEDLGNKLGRYYDLSEKLDPVGQEDGDIDNDGDEDKTDDYLANRRKAVSKAIKNEDMSPKVGGPAGQRWGIVTGKKGDSPMWRNW